MSSDANIPNTNLSDADIFGMKPNTYCMLIHLSQLLNFTAPCTGFIASIVLWAIAKDKSPHVDQHGKIVLNWILSALIYGIAGFLLCFIVVGVLILIALMVSMIAFPIIGAVKANGGIVWKYPLCIPFFK